jgi:hypothetical protein
MQGEFHMAIARDFSHHAQKARLDLDRRRIDGETARSFLLGLHRLYTIHRRFIAASQRGCQRGLIGDTMPPPIGRKNFPGLSVQQKDLSGDE